MRLLSALMALLSVGGCCWGSTLDVERSRYRLVWGTDPSSAASFQWEQTSPRPVSVRYKTTGDWRDADTRCEEVLSSWQCFAALQGLPPASRVDLDVAGRELHFETAPDTPAPFTFVAGGDSRAAGEMCGEQRCRERAAQLVARTRPLFVLFGGDYGNLLSYGCLATWLDDWQHTIAEDGRLIPLVPAIGNHERLLDGQASTLCRLFDLPCLDHGEQMTVDYRVRVGGSLASLVTLDSELYADQTAPGYAAARIEQLAWLDRTLAERSIWRIVQYHRPLKPHSQKAVDAGKAYPDQLESWAPLFWRHRVDLASESDAHVYKMTAPLRVNGDGDDLEPHEHGTVFMGEGSWSVVPRACVSYDWTRVCRSAHQYKLVHVDAQRLSIRTIDLDETDPAQVPPQWSPDDPCRGMTCLPVDDTDRTELTLYPRDPGGAPRPPPEPEESPLEEVIDELKPDR